MFEQLLRHEPRPVGKNIADVSPERFESILSTFELTPIQSDLHFTLETEEKTSLIDSLGVRMIWEPRLAQFKLRGLMDYIPSTIEGEDVSRRHTRDLTEAITTGGKFGMHEFFIPEGRNNRGQGFKEFKREVLPFLKSAGYQPRNAFIILDTPRRRARGFETTRLIYQAGNLRLEFQNKRNPDREQQILAWWDHQF